MPPVILPGLTLNRKLTFYNSEFQKMARIVQTGICNSAYFTIPLGSRIILKGHLGLQTARATKGGKSPWEQASFGSVPKPSHRQLASFGSSCLSRKHEPGTVQ